VLWFPGFQATEAEKEQSCKVERDGELWSWKTVEDEFGKCQQGVREHEGKGSQNCPDVEIRDDGKAGHEAYDSQIDKDWD